MSDLTFGDWFIAGLGVASGWIIAHDLAFQLDQLYIRWRSEK